MKITKLIMFSGGLDSTYVLWKAIQNKDDIWVHHVILKNISQNRWKEELEASRKIIAYFKKTTDFPYTESTWDMCMDENDVSRMIWDADVIAFIASQVAKYIESDVIMHVDGRVMEDDLMESSKKHVYYSQLIWKASTEEFRDRIVDSIQKPIRYKWKKELVEEMPEELLNLVWSCLYPVNGKPCNKCKSCIDLNTALEGKNRI